MNAVQETEGVKRKAGTAVTLSLVMSGLGHLYCGRLVTGLAWAAAGAVTVPLVFAAMLAGSAWLWAAVILALVVWTAAAIHAGIIARRISGSYQLREYNRGVVYALLIVIASIGSLSYALLVRAQYAEAFVMFGQSMSPTVRQGDRMLVLKTAYRDEPVERRDVLVFRNPEAPSQRWVKRVVGLPGDVVEIREGAVWINGERLVVPAEVDAAAKQVETMAPLTVPPHHVFVLGDNLAGSRDSRHLGPVPMVAIVGRVETIYWPAGDWGRFGRPQ